MTVSNEAFCPDYTLTTIPISELVKAATGESTVNHHCLFGPVEHVEAIRVIPEH